MIRIVTVTVLLVLLGTAPLALATDLDKFRGRVGKSAPESVDSTPPVVCLCLSAGPTNLRVGQLLSGLASGSEYPFLNILAFCAVLQFRPDGTALLQDSCTDFILLPK